MANEKIGVFDLHCDTLTAFLNRPDYDGILEQLNHPGLHSKGKERLVCAIEEQDSLDDRQLQFSLSHIPEQTFWAQCCAIFIPDGLDPESTVLYYDLHRQNFFRQMQKFSDCMICCSTGEEICRAWKQGRTAAVLTVENGSVLAGQLGRVEQLAADGVRMITLTWNGANELGSGWDTEQGLTNFGKEAVREMENCGVVVDVSHLNDRGFFQLLDVVQKPFAASHSNARTVCGHRRNLTREQIVLMAERRCLIGLNFGQTFLKDDSGSAGLEDLWRHVEYFLELGAENSLVLGSDADGTNTLIDLNRPYKVRKLYDFFISHGVPEAVAEKIMWKNALNFWSM